jgi:bifunctional DNA-binding transcriptional regulator/antitoxin component of YhaV-PrlF toxin-antitoxin module
MEVEVARAKVGEGWRVVIPAALRPRIGAEIGEELLFRSTPGGLLVTTLDQAVAESRQLVSRFIPPSVDLQADLQALRRRDAGLA